MYRWVQMIQPTYPGLDNEFYGDMLVSTFNVDIIFIEVRVKAISVTIELISSALGLPNAGIIIRKMKKDAKPHPKYDREYGLQTAGSKRSHLATSVRLRGIYNMPWKKCYCKRTMIIISCPIQNTILSSFWLIRGRSTL